MRGRSAGKGGVKVPIAICGDCGREMVEGGGCTVQVLISVNGDSIDRIKHGDAREGLFVEEKTCHDCAVALGEYHHFGCDVERCPTCSGQLISCEHYFIPG